MAAATAPIDIQRGIFATEVGVPRLLRLFKKYDMKTSFFAPGHIDRKLSQRDADDRRRPATRSARTAICTKTLLP